MAEIKEWIFSSTAKIEDLCENKDLAPLKIPSYQREYEWDAYNVQRLLIPLYDGVKEETFLGALQIADNEEDGKFIVDGRQRLTTLALLYAVLAKRFNLEEDRRLYSLLDDQKLTEAIKKIQEKDLEVFATVGNRHDVTRLNPNGKTEAKKIDDIYYRNAIYLNTALESEKFNDLDKTIAEKMFHSVFFIVVRIKNRELSQVIRIFDSLNSTGQELSDEAMFKLRYHSFLRLISSDKLSSEEIMDQINEGYKKVTVYNENCLIPVNMGDVLWGYRTYLLTIPEVRKILNQSDMTYGSLGFFETLFGKENSRDLHEFLSIEKFHKYIDSHLNFYRLAYPKDGSFGITTKEEAVERIIGDLLYRTRYGSSWAIPIAYYVRNVEEKKMNEADAYKDAISKAKSVYQLLFYYSVIYDKGVKRVKTDFLWRVMEEKKDESLDSICRNQIENEEEIRRKNEKYQPFWRGVRDNFYWNYDRAYSFLAVMEACAEMDSTKDFKSFLKKVFPWEKENKRPEIEHIYCRTHFQEKKAGLTNEELAKFNGLGNLVLLEGDINKNTLKNGYPSDKFVKKSDVPSSEESKEKVFFARSEFAFVRCLRKEYEDYKQNGENLDVAKNWLRVIDDRYEKMKEQFISLFPLLGSID